ncbi:T9SS type A sorting domain-containing protein [candidate division KSB1 bacterium]|nr:T9SS type A sorting domain-containing protein [candidate division KSB1 bacterium]
MRQINTYLMLLIFLSAGAMAQVNNTNVQLVKNHNNWGWDAYVMGNGLITTATVPDIGARIMQYDLGGHKSIYVNNNELGKTYTPENNNVWPNFGGFKNWPAPQSRWSWPPPPILDYGKYETEIISDTPDSVSIRVSSPVEKWDAPGIRFVRLLTIYKGSSRVKVDQTMVNEGSVKENWSMWDITQCIVNHPGKSDFENFWVYFTINPDSRYGDDGVRWDKSSGAWVGEVAPGIYGVQFENENKKIFADSHEGWICYVDELDGYAYAKTFELFKEGNYPDEGAHVEVWIDGDYLEVEVVSPVVELAANGGNYTFTENWWASKVNGPIQGVNNAGAIAEKLNLTDYGTIRADYGVFYEGTAKIVFLDGNEVLGEGKPQQVTPLETYKLREQLRVPEGTTRVEVWVYDFNGTFVGVLESASYPLPTTVGQDMNRPPENFDLLQNYPNPFNPVTTIKFNLPVAEKVKLTVYDITGQAVAVLLNEELSRGEHRCRFEARDLANGIYIYRLQSGDVDQTRKMLLLK